MILVLAAWVLASPVIAWIIGRAIRIADLRLASAPDPWLVSPDTARWTAFTGEQRRDAP